MEKTKWALIDKETNKAYGEMEMTEVEAGYAIEALKSIENLPLTYIPMEEAIQGGYYDTF